MIYLPTINNKFLLIMFVNKKPQDFKKHHELPYVGEWIS